MYCTVLQCTWINQLQSRTMRTVPKCQVLGYISYNELRPDNIMHLPPVKEEGMDDGGLLEGDELGGDQLREAEMDRVGELPGAQVHGLEGGEDPVEQGDVRAVLGDVDGVEAEQVLEGHHLVAGLHHAGPEGEHRAAV